MQSYRTTTSRAIQEDNNAKCNPKILHRIDNFSKHQNTKLL